MIRCLLLLLIPSLALAQSGAWGVDFSGVGVREPTNFTVCAYGDSITQNGWFTPLTDAGITVANMGFGGARVSGPRTDDGDEVVPVCFTPLPCTVEGDKCKDVIGDSAIEALCLEEMVTFCDVGTVMYGTNDVSADPPLPDYQAGLTAVLDEFKLRDVPVVIWRPIQRMDNASADARIVTNMPPLTAAAIAASGYSRVSEVDAYAFWSTYRSDKGDTAYFGLYGDCTSQGVGTDCVHPELSVPNSLGDLGADLVGEQMLRAVHGAMRSQ